MLVGSGPPLRCSPLRASPRRPFASRTKSRPSVARSGRIIGGVRRISKRGVFQAALSREDQDPRHSRERGQGEHASGAPEQIRKGRPEQSDLRARRARGVRVRSPSPAPTFPDASFPTSGSAFLECPGDDGDQDPRQGGSRFLRGASPAGHRDIAPAVRRAASRARAVVHDAVGA